MLSVTTIAPASIYAGFTNTPYSSRLQGLGFQHSSMDGLVFLGNLRDSDEAQMLTGRTK